FRNESYCCVHNLNTLRSPIIGVVEKLKNCPQEDIYFGGTWIYVLAALSMTVMLVTLALYIYRRMQKSTARVWSPRTNYDPFIEEDSLDKVNSVPENCGKTGKNSWISIGECPRAEFVDVTKDTSGIKASQNNTVGKNIGIMFSPTSPDPQDLVEEIMSGNRGSASLGSSCRIIPENSVCQNLPLQNQAASEEFSVPIPHAKCTQPGSADDGKCHHVVYDCPLSVVLFLQEIYKE
ncbi:unnamed protein product, partial [Allacma fusca]